jgi:transposase-like protein
MNTTDLRACLEQADSKEAGALLRKALQSKMREALMEIFEEEVQSLCGSKHAPDRASDYYRAGTSPAKVKLGGQEDAIRRPRVRKSLGDASAEKHLASWKAAKDPEAWEQSLFRAVLCGVSTRSAQRLHESELKGLSKSAVSRLWASKAKALIDEMLGRDLSELGILVVMLDGIYLCEGLCSVAAIGIDRSGAKHVLGFRIGSSENSEVCRDLVGDLHRRGLRPAQAKRFLAVLDGSKALKNALLEMYPNTVTQRCLVHKERNLRGYLSKRHWADIGRLFKQLRKSEGKKDALERLAEIETFLEGKNAEALKSLKEAGSDLIAFFALEVPSTLNRSLLSTNAIENAFLNLRRHIGRVCRWRTNTDQADRWVASGLFLSEKTFHRIPGCDDMDKLEAALTNSSQVPHGEPAKNGNSLEPSHELINQ